MRSQTRVLYVGMTNNIERRVYEHKSGTITGFSQKYRTHSLVYFEETSDVWGALDRERSLKGWTRARKIELIVGENPDWDDLSAGWTDEHGGRL
jgi:putative endonuclease